MIGTQENVDLDRSTRPGKWQKRGPQPPVESSGPSQREKLAAILESIRLEKKPTEKARLERLFEQECHTYDGIIQDPLLINLPTICSQMSEAFSASPMVRVEMTIPEDVQKPEWEGLHRAILACRKHASAWLMKSRRFAAEKWGREYLAQAEVQLEMDLGIDRTPKIENNPAPLGIKKVEAFCRAWGSIQEEPFYLKEWDTATIRRAVELLEPIVAAVEEMRRAVQQA